MCDYVLRPAAWWLIITQEPVCLRLSSPRRFPPCSACLGSVCLEVARVTRPAVLFSRWPSQPCPALVPRRPLLPSEACSSSDKGCSGQTLSRAPQCRCTPTMCTLLPSALTPFTCENTGAYLQLTGAVAANQCVCVCVCAHK